LAGPGAPFRLLRAFAVAGPTRSLIVIKLLRCYLFKVGSYAMMHYYVISFN
jgi:hypothetical protein